MTVKYYYDNSISYTTTISMSDAVYKFMEAQSNKSGTIRMLLNDALKMCPEMLDYTHLSEATRLRRFFNYVPKAGTEQVKRAMVNDIDALLSNQAAMQRMAVIARYAHLWRRYVDSLVPLAEQCCAAGFIVHAAEDCIAQGDKGEPEITFALHLKQFLSDCAKGNDGVYKVEISRVDDEYIQTLFVLYDAYDLQAKPEKRLLRYTPSYAAVARDTLNAIRQYYMKRYGVISNSLAMDMLHTICRERLERPEKDEEASQEAKA